MIRFIPLILVLFPYSGWTQPPVHQEPHHVPIFQNRFIRILNVQAESGDTTLFHVHNKDIAYYTINGSNIWLQELNQPSKTVNLPTGWASSNVTHSVSPFVHRFANVGLDLFQLIAIEILSTKFIDLSFNSFGNVLFEDARCSIQTLERLDFTAKVPAVVIHLESNGAFEGIEYLKPNEAIREGKTSTRAVIIQVK